MRSTGTDAVSDDVRMARIDVLEELDKIARSQDMAVFRNVTSEVYGLYKERKKSGFFRDVFSGFGNVEIPVWQINRTCDVFYEDVWTGRAYFVIEASREALNAFNDDGYVIMKIKGWLVESYRKAISDLRTAHRSSMVRIWDYAFTRTGSPLPCDVLVLPYYDSETLPGVPVVTLMLVRPK